MVPHLKQNNSAEGLSSGVEQVNEHIRQNKDSIMWSVLHLIHKGYVSLQYVVVAAVGVFLLFGGYIEKQERKKEKTCTMCGSEMNILPAKPLLNTGQLMEESLESAHYNLLSCPNCNATKTAKVKKESKFTTCPNCHFDTEETTGEKIDSQHPAYFNRSYFCYNCKHTREENYPHGRHYRLSSGGHRGGSSGGGFSGGHSSGGGGGASF